jgi:hypothetical protein
LSAGCAEAEVRANITREDAPPLWVLEGEPVSMTGFNAEALDVVHKWVGFGRRRLFEGGAMGARWWPGRSWIDSLMVLGVACCSLTPKTKARCAHMRC